MEEVIKLVEDLINNRSINLIVLSDTKLKEYAEKIRIKKYRKKEGNYFYQSETIADNKAYHKNYEEEELKEILIKLLSEAYKRAVIFTDKHEYNIMLSKRGRSKIIKRDVKETKKSNVEHNKKKNYTIPENEKCDFLIELGIMTPDGIVKKQWYSKFRQINRFLEIIENSLERFLDQDVIRIIDFGCGKAYLTFAVYYYLCIIKNRKVDIIGIDIKQDVINNLNDIAKKLCYEGLCFLNGTIEEYDTFDRVDMIISLHACDNATDDVIIKGIKWKSKSIICVPCCQHEFFKKINSDVLAPILRYGVLKDKMSSIVTDSIRTLVLQIFGYNTNVIEFTSLEHTMKNVLIKAEYSGK